MQYFPHVSHNLYVRSTGAYTRRGRRKKTLCNEEELHDMSDTPKKKEEHIYPVMSPSQFNRAVTPISPV